jgi:hypothetical protein
MALIAQIDVREGVESAWESVITFVPKLLAFLVILLIGILIAKLVEKLLNAILERVGFDRLVERGGVRRALARSKFDASDILAKIVFYTLVLITLQLAFGVFGPNPVSDLLKSVIAYLPKVFVAILIVVIAAAIARALTDLLSSLLGAVQGGQLIARGAGVAVLVLAVFAALDQLQIAPRIVTGLWYALLAAVVGSVVVAVGGGGIGTMQRYWERTAGRAEERGPELRQQLRASARSAQPDRPGAYQPTQTYQPSGGAYAADDATDDLGDGRTRRNL